MDADAAAYRLSWVRLAQLIAVFLALGVVAEFGDEWVGRSLEKILDDAKDRQIAASLASAAQANSRAGRATREAVKLNERAAQLEKEAVEAKLELARIKTARTLTIQQQKRIAEKIRPFAGKQFDVATLQGDPEAIVIMETIEGAVTAADWKQIDWKDKLGGAVVLTRKGRPSVGNVTVTGVIIQIASSKKAALWDAAQALAAALNDEDIAAFAIEEPSVNVAANDDAIHILIGKKM